MHDDVMGLTRPEIYRPLAQAPQSMMMLAVRTTGDANALTGGVRAAIAEVDPSQPVYHVKTLRRLLDDALTPSAAVMSMMTFFGALALLLATVGIYG